MKARRTRLGARSGNAILGALFVVITVAGLSLAYLQLVVGNTNEQRTSIDTKRAFYMAEAGLAESYAALRSGGTGSVGTAQVPARFGNGMFWVEATDLEDGRKVLRSTGLCGTGRHTLEVVVQPELDDRLGLGAFGLERVTVGPGSVVATRAPAEGPDPGPLPLGSNGDIVVGENSVVHGDATPGVGEAVEVNPGAEVLGSTAPRETSIAVTAPRAPFDSGDTDTTVPSRGILELPAGEHSIRLLGVERGGTLHLVGPTTLVVDELVVQSSGQLSIDDGAGAVEIFVFDALLLESGSSVVTSSGASRSLQIHAMPPADRNGVPATVRLLPDVGFTGRIHAPASEVELADGVDFLGSAVGRRITIGGGVTFEIDADALLPGGFEDGAGTLTWMLDDVPDARMARIRLDPYRLMKFLGLEAPPSHEAYDLPPDAYLDPEYQTATFDRSAFEDEQRALEELGIYRKVDATVTTSDATSAPSSTGDATGNPSTGP